MHAFTTRIRFLLLAPLLALALAALLFWRPEAPCAEQSAQTLTPHCVAQAAQRAGAGDVGAMLLLASHYTSAQPAQAARWTLQAARHGERGAIGQVFGACGEGRAYSVRDAESLLAHAPPLDALHARLGGSCLPADLAVARKLEPRSLLASDDSAGLCKVALRYGLLRMTPAGRGLDGEGARLLLAECERRSDREEGARRAAETLRQMLAREIQPLHITVP